MELEFDYGGRELTDEEKQLLEEERGRVLQELKIRFGKVICPDVSCDHFGSGVKHAVMELVDFPNVDFRFKDACCEAMERELYNAAKAR